MDDDSRQTNRGVEKPQGELNTTVKKQFPILECYVSHMPYWEQGK